MYLKRLEIHGFKSFAQKTTLEFSQGVIAVVGPNGSGKSNVADAVRWVLGEQSAKMVRGKKSDDVIFAGSDKKTRLGFAEVTATFDNADKRIPLDASEVSIGRRIDRSGESEYLINGNKVRLLDIVDLVLKSNIGTSRYTVIGQGTIDQMILQGPSEIKNLLDEASGVKSYYMKREKTMRRMEQTAQNLMRAEDLIAEIAPRLRSLRRQAKRMEARAEIEQELKIYEREMFGKTFWALRSELDKIEVNLKDLEEKKNFLEHEAEKFDQEARKVEGLHGESFSKFREIQEELANLQSKKNQMLESLSLVRGKMQGQKNFSAGDSNTLQLNLHELTGKDQDLKSQIEAAEEGQKEHLKNISSAKTKLTELEAKLQKLYLFLQNPNTIDWQGFNQQFKMVESAFADFYGKIQGNQPWPEVSKAIEGFRGSFGKFKDFVGKAFHDPSVSANLQGELQVLLKAKEELNQQVQSAELEESKTKITLDFLKKESHRISQEKLQVELEAKKASGITADQFLTELISEEDKIKAEVEIFSQKISHLEGLFGQERASQEHGQKHLREVESQLREKQAELSKIKDQISLVQVEKAKFDTQMEVLKEEVFRVLGENEWVSLAGKKEHGQTEGLEDKIMKLKGQLDNIGGMDELTLKEYQETESRYSTLSNQVADLKQGMGDLRQIMDELDEHIKQKFNESFHKINEKFEYYFRVLFNGGRAFLSIVKSEEEKAQIENDQQEEGDDQQNNHLRPEEKVVQKYEKGANNIAGIDIKATPPNKKLASIQALSGGERALTSIALLCSLLACFPSPFVMLDEVDAALDDANTIRFGQILGTLAHQTQFITITHNRETMAQAIMLYGVTMGDDGISKLLSVKLEQAKAYAK